MAIGLRNPVQVVRTLEQLEINISKEAGQVAQEIKEVLSEEARNLVLEQSAWNEVADIIRKLRSIFEDLKIAETHPNSGSSAAALRAALVSLSAIAAEVNAINAKIFTAVSMDKREEAVARKAADQLKAIHGQLNIEAARINQLRFNNLVT